MEEAELLAIYDRDGYDEVFIVNPEGDEMAHYVLVNRDDSVADALPEGAVIIYVPLEKVIIDSEVYAGVFEELEVTDAIRGMFDTPYVTSPSLKAEILTGLIEDMGNGMSPNVEKIVSMEPDAIFVSYFEGMQTEGLDRLGAPVIKMYDLQESTPMGRAEWIRFLGRLTGRGEEADSIFNDGRNRYNAIRETSNSDGDSGERPKVLTELTYDGTWAVPGGRSYQARLIKDAGGMYFKEGDDNPVSINLAPEQVVVEGSDADVWVIRYFGDEEQLKGILDSDPLYKEIKAYKEGDVYFSDTSKSGLFREFPFHPELLLEDYRIIFSGDTVTPMRYFKKLGD